MSIFTKTVEIDPLDAALTEGRGVRDALGSYVRGLDSATSALDAVIVDEQAKVQDAQNRIEIAAQEKAINVGLATNLRNIGFTDQ